MEEEWKKWRAFFFFSFFSTFSLSLFCFLRFPTCSRFPLPPPSSPPRPISSPLFLSSCKMKENEKRRYRRLKKENQKKKDSKLYSARQLADKEAPVRARRRDHGLRRVEADVVDRARVARQRVLERSGLGVPDVGGSFFVLSILKERRRERNKMSFFFFVDFFCSKTMKRKKPKTKTPNSLTVRRARGHARPAVVPRPAAPQQVALQRVRRADERPRAPLGRRERPDVPAAERAVARVGEQVGRGRVGRGAGLEREGGDGVGVADERQGGGGGLAQVPVLFEK